MRCLRCNTENATSEIYCVRCGAVLAPEMGELRTVTVLFADIRGFTALSEQRTAEEIATRIINECFTLLAEQIEAYGGVVDKFIGDAIMALFGAPRAHENDPERAIMAALAMQDVLAHFSQRVEKIIGNPLEMRIGINTGEAVAGWFGSVRNRAYTVIGDAVNLASRIEHAGQAGKIWVHETTFRQAAYAFDFEPVGPLELKGKSKPVMVHEVRSVKAMRERRRGVPGLHAPMVDRRAGLAALHDALMQVMQGHGRIVSLIGEAGIGKSRLWAEFEDLARREESLADALALKGRSLPYGQLNTFGTVREILNGYLGGERGEADVAVLKAQADIGDVPLLGQLLGLGLPLGRYESYSPEELAREIHRAVIRLMRQAAQAHLLVLTFEDVHWIDPSSLLLLRELFSALSDHRALACCLYRPDFSGLTDVTDAHIRITLPPLSEAESRDLIKALLAVQDLPELLKQTIVQKAAGNPFYVEELLKSLIEAGVIAQRDGRWAVVGDPSSISVPDTVQGVMMTRIDGLPEATKRTLQQAAVIGPAFQASLLAELADEQVDEHLAHLQELGFIAGTNGEYRFKNLLSQEVAYNSLLLAQRQALHTRIAAALEQSYAERLESQFATLADHYERGGLWPKALEYRKKAGARAQRLYDNSVAVTHFSHALDIITRWEQGPQSLLDAERTEAYPEMPTGFFDSERVEVWTARGDVLALTGQYELALADFQSALERAGSSEMRAELLWRIGSVHEKLSQYDKALAALQAGIVQAESSPESPALPKLLSTQGWVHIRQGQPEQARTVSEQSLALAHEERNPREAALAYKTLGHVAYSQGNWDEATDRWRRSLQLAERAGDRREAGRLSSNLGSIAARHSRYNDAIAYFQRGLKSLERIGDVEAIATIHNNLGGAYALAGQYARAREYYQRGLLAHERLGHSQRVIECQINLGELARKTGDLPQAISYLEAGLKLAQQVEDQEDLPEIHRQLAATYLAANNLSLARQHGEHALDNARKTGNRLEEGIAQRVLGQIASEQLQLDRAAEHLAQSRIILEELSQYELALTLMEEAALLEGEEQRKTFERAYEIFVQLDASTEAEGVKRLIGAYGYKRSHP